MDSHAPSYHGYRCPPALISHAVWLYHRFCLSFRDTEDLLAQRGITVSYEAIRQWCRRFGPAYTRILRRRQGRLGDTWHLDELFVHIQGRQQYLWRAVDQDGDVIDLLLQPRRDRRAAAPTRHRERQMRRFKSSAHAQRFLSVHGLVRNLFRVGRHLLRAAHHRSPRTRSFLAWNDVTCAC